VSLWLGYYCQIASFMERFRHCSQTQGVHMSILNLIASLDVEEKSQTKDGQSKGAKD
jgi:hypothetical protein